MHYDKRGKLLLLCLTMTALASFLGGRPAGGGGGGGG